MVNDNRKCYIMIQLRRHKLTKCDFPSFYSSTREENLTTVRVKIYLRINVNNRNVR